MRFARQDGFLAQEQHGDVAVRRHGGGLVEGRTRPAARVLHGLHVTQLRAVAGQFPDGLQRRDGQPDIAIENPGAELLVRRIGQRTDDRDRRQAFQVERQRRAFVDAFPAEPENDARRRVLRPARRDVKV